MYNLIPEVKYINEGKGARTQYTGFAFAFDAMDDRRGQDWFKKILPRKMWNLFNIPYIVDGSPGNDFLKVQIRQGFDSVAIPPSVDVEKLTARGYSLIIEKGICFLHYSSFESLTNALSTLKQLITPRKEGFELEDLTIFDYPDVEIRSMSTTFAWYAGYGRIGFDSQLWGFDKWCEFLNICSDFKINQLNMCMYGYWPFEFPEYPETCFRNIPVKVWNHESENTLEILYTHPNLRHEFLIDLIDYAHSLSIRIFTYIGLNSYNGGFSNIHKEKRMKLPENSKFVNDFDSLCLSDPENIEYLKTAMKRIVGLGLDGIVFEESEEAYWFCTCEKCTERFGKTTSSPAEAKHEANYTLLRTLYEVIKKENPSCEIGLRAWREPPLEKTEEYLRHCRNSIPDDVCLYWAPGLYVPEKEFTKWVDTFGPARICARDAESNAWSSTQGRLLRIFKSNVLRSSTETNDQFIEKDIEQHRGSVAHSVRGINGYLFEWYGYFLHLLAHANYGWGGTMEEDAFYDRAVRLLFGNEIADDILYVLRNILTIHESQINLFPVEFPFLRNNVTEEDIPAIEKARSEWPVIDEKLERIIAYCDAGKNEYVQHFRKIRNAHRRNYHIYNLCLAAVRYDNATDEKEKQKILLEMEEHNEKDFALVKEMFFDIYPVSQTGIKACMYPYHELKRVIDNETGRNSPPDEEMVFLGVEALGWLWI